MYFHEDNVRCGLELVAAVALRRLSAQVVVEFQLEQQALCCAVDEPWPDPCCCRKTGLLDDGHMLGSPTSIRTIQRMESKWYAGLFGLRHYPICGVHVWR